MKIVNMHLGSTNPMRTFAAMLLGFLFLTTVASACICDLECPDGEVYSDEAEMCVAQDAPTS